MMGGQNHNPKMICQGETFCFVMFQEHINFWVLNMKVRAFRFRKTTKILLICKILMNIDEEKMFSSHQTIVYPKESNNNDTWRCRDRLDGSWAKIPLSTGLDSCGAMPLSHSSARFLHHRSAIAEPDFQHELLASPLFSVFRWNSGTILALWPPVLTRRNPGEPSGGALPLEIVHDIVRAPWTPQL